MAWRFVLVQLDGTPIGTGSTIHKAYERRVQIPLNGLPTASVQLKLGDPLIEEVFDLDGDVLLKVYQGSTLRFIGDLLTAEEVGKGYRRLLDRQGLANVLFALPAEDVKRSTNVTSVNARGRMEEVVPNDLADPGLRQALVDAHAQIRGDARQQITFGPPEGDDQPSVMLNFAGPLWRLSKRLCGKTDFSVTPPNTELTIAPMDLGEMGWDIIRSINVEGDTGLRRGTVTTSVASGAGPWTFKPVGEALTELAAVSVYPFETPTWTIQEDWAHPPGGGVAGRALATGTGTWAEHGSGGMSVEPTSDLRRGASGDVEWVGAYLAAGSQTFTNVIVQSDVRFDAGPYNGKLGVFARASFGGSGTHFIMAALEPLETSVLRAYKCVADQVTPLELTTVGGLAAVFYNIRLQVHDNGEWFIWGLGFGSIAETMLLRGYDPDLATGGVLATGLVGVYDENRDSGTPVTRTYDVFRAGIPSVAPTLKEMDFELAPEEPVDQSGTVTVDTATDVLTLAAGHSFVADQPVVFAATTIPAGLAVGRVYYVMSTPLTGTTFKVSATPGGGSIDITSSGTAVTVDGGVKIATYNTAPRIGTDKSATVFFEYGQGSRASLDLANAPEFGTDYIVGDVVAGRAKAADGSTRFNAAFRIYGIDVTIDENGKEQVTPTLIPDS